MHVESYYLSHILRPPRKDSGIGVYCAILLMPCCMQECMWLPIACTHVCKKEDYSGIMTSRCGWLAPWYSYQGASQSWYSYIDSNYRFIVCRFIVCSFIVCTCRYAKWTHIIRDASLDLESNIPPAASDDGYDVGKALHPVAAQWRAVGRGLRIQSHTLDRISAENNNDPRRCLQAMIDEWLKNIQHPNWRKIVEIVAEPVGGNNVGEARKIAAAHPGMIFDSQRNKWTQCQYAFCSMTCTNFPFQSVAMCSLSPRPYCCECYCERVGSARSGKAYMGAKLYGLRLYMYNYSVVE